MGIGGIGMSGIASILLSQDYVVSGSDLMESDTTKDLIAKGATISYFHKADNVEGADTVVISSAVTLDNEEVVAAQKRNIPVIPRAEMLAELMKIKVGIAIAGTHGKTTTTSILAALTTCAGMDPTIVIGGKVDMIGGNAHLGKGKYLLAEADESDKSFLCLPATIVTVTNIDNDHLDNYGSLEEIKKSFVQFINKIPAHGRAILCIDDPNVRSILPKIKKPFITYGFSPDASIRPSEVKSKGFSSVFQLSCNGEVLGSQISTNLIGKHNILNSMAAIGVALEIGLSFSQIQDGFKKFTGVRRRMERKGEKKGILVMDDYAHHPTEIEVTLEGLRSVWSGRIVVLFQPHRFSRTRDCYDSFLSVFQNIDVLFITDIYSAGEEPIDGISSQQLVKDMEKKNGSTKPSITIIDDFMKNQASVHTKIMPLLDPGDLFITLGAGNVYRVGERILEELS